MALNTPLYEKFKNAFVDRCFKLVTRAYVSSCSDKVIQLNWDENDISSELHRYIDSDPLRVQWKVSTNVESHVRKDIPKIKGFANKYPRIDFRLTSFISEFEYQYFFEAKNLKTSDSALKRRYIETGIDNFVSGKYPNGSILAYLLEGTPEEAVNGINSLLNKDNRKTEVLTFKESDFLNDYCESNHLQIGILRHLIFDFTALAS